MGVHTTEPPRPLILVIDDDDPTREALVLALEAHGYRATGTADGAAAMKMLESDRPAAIVLDLYMPDMDGMALVGALRAQPDAASTSIVFLSGDQDSETRFQALAAGGDDFLTKPILPRHLVAAVLTRGRRARQLHASTRAPASAGSTASNVFEMRRAG